MTSPSDSLDALGVSRELIANLQARPSWTAPAAHAIGMATISTLGDGTKVLDSYFPFLNLGENNGFAALMGDLAGVEGSAGTTVLSTEVLTRAKDLLAPIVADGGNHPNARMVDVLLDALGAEPPVTPSRRVAIFTRIADLGDAPLDAHDAYLRLHLLSSRRIKPHGCSLDGMFGLLNNVVWTNLGPIDPEDFEETRSRLRARGTVVTVNSVDKFPQMADYVIPSGVRIAAPNRVRLGAYLGEGTTVMHEGFVNFNAGTEGPA